ncbi:MAG: hypothetical protein ABSG13_30715 [Bryobacteraceae bacterium]|jgi:hypothetical protein
MSRVTGQPSMKALGEVVDLLVESQIKLDALDSVLKEINPLLHERYLGEIENVKAREAAELRRALTTRLRAKLAQG